MSRTTDAVIYLSELELLNNYQFLHEIYTGLTKSENFEHVEKVNAEEIGFYNILATEIENEVRVKVGFHVTRVQVISSDIVRHVNILWNNQPEKSEKLFLVTDGNVQSDAYDTAEKLGIILWSGFSLYSLKYPFKKRASRIVSREENLSEALKTLHAGKVEWYIYQTLCCDIFSHLFCPPLEPPRFENTDEDKRNRRDMIFENSSDHSYWKMLRNIYKADYIVVDAKNYSAPIEKQSVLDIAHYLKPYGCGLFGIILTRNGASDGAKHAIREQWTSGSKLILVLNDIDLLDMLKMKEIGRKPEELIKIKIADFRMSL